MKFGFADPPYLGQGAKLYGKHHAEAHLWDEIATHQALVERLSDEWPDGWALCASSNTLQRLLPLCPSDVRVCAWVKPFAVFKPNVGLAYTWEPVILRGGRKISRAQPTVRDWCAENITLRKGLTGAKPRRFCAWVLSMLNAQAGDTVEDLFPGTGVFGDVATDYLIRAEIFGEAPSERGGGR